MIRGKKLYDSLPVWLQTLAANVVSSRNFRQKYGQVFHQTLDRLAQNEKKSRDELMHDQQQALKRSLAYALQHVSYYREHRFSPDNLGDWPILEKQTVAASPEQFLSDEFSPGELMELHSSGTTGTPLAVKFSRDYHQMEMAFRWRHKAWAGVPFLSSSAYISGHPLVPASQTRPPFWRVDRVEKRLLCSSYHLAPQNLPAYVEALAKFAPDFVHGYPSSLYVLAQYMFEKNVEKVRPRAVFTASETLLDFQRTAIEAAFGAKVFNWYGNTEMTCNIIQCATGNLHYRTDYGLLELLEDGTMICTGLNNLAMPMIRYRVGDVAVARDGVCACGCAFPLIERIEGRIEDYVRTPDGRFVGRLDHLFKDVHHVREAQIVQTRLDELVLRIVKADGFSSKDEQIILKEARMRLGDAMAIRFEFVDRIERTAAGKFRFIVSQLPREQLEFAKP
jgi:phenylacetate-CoA ligase